MNRKKVEDIRNGDRIVTICKADNEGRYTRKDVVVFDRYFDNYRKLFVLCVRDSTGRTFSVRKARGTTCLMAEEA